MSGQDAFWEFTIEEPFTNPDIAPTHQRRRFRHKPPDERDDIGPAGEFLN